MRFFALAWLFLFGLELAMRALLMHETGSKLYALHQMLPAIAADALVAMGFALIVRGARFFSLSVDVVLLAALWALMHWPNMESIVALGQPVDLADIAYVKDADFLQGSLQAFSFPLFYPLSLALALIALLCLNRHPVSSPKARAISIGAGLLVLAVGGYTSVDEFSDWRTTHPLFLTLGTAISEEYGLEPDSLEAVEPAPPVLRPLLKQERSQARDGEPLQERRHNVLLIALEGIPGAYVRSVREYFGLPQGSDQSIDAFQMPGLSNIAEQGQVTPNFVAHTRQTIRGLYSLLCGDYPKLTARSTTPKTMEYLQLPPANRPACLPTILADRGYQTLYLQSAPLAFMSKDRFMPAAGFVEVHGSEWFEQQDSLNGWGASDDNLFRKSLQRLQQANEAEQPWFATLLTVGTHHPYDVTDEEAARYPSRKLAAVAKLDAALQEFMEGLKASGLLNDTLVIITADESHDIPNQRHGANWGLNIALAPELQPGIKEGIFGQLDMAVSILDYLGVPDREGWLQGESFFQNEYVPQSRPMLFSRGQLFAYLGDGKTLGCVSAKRCRQYQAHNGKLFAESYEEGSTFESDSARPEWLLARSANQRLRNGISNPNQVVFLQQQQTTVGKHPTYISAGQYIDIPAGQKVSVQLDLSVPEGSAAASPTLEIRARGEQPVDLPVKLPIMQPGERLQVTLSFSSGEFLLNAFEANLRGRTKSASGATINVTDYRAAWREGGSGAGRGINDIEVQQFSLTDNKGEQHQSALFQDHYFIAKVLDADSIVYTDSEHLDSDGYLIQGWSHPEKWGTWSQGEESVVGFHLNDSPPIGLDEFVLDLDLQAFVTPEKNQSFQLSLNGLPLGEQTITWPARNRHLKLQVPANALREGLNTLAFHIDNPRSPKELGVSNDARPIAVGLRKLAIRYPSSIRCLLSRVGEFLSADSDPSEHCLL